MISPNVRARLASTVCLLDCLFEKGKFQDGILTMFVISDSTAVQDDVAAIATEMLRTNGFTEKVFISKLTVADCQKKTALRGRTALCAVIDLKAEAKLNADRDTAQALDRTLFSMSNYLRCGNDSLKMIVGEDDPGEVSPS